MESWGVAPFIYEGSWNISQSVVHCFFQHQLCLSKALVLSKLRQLPPHGHRTCGLWGGSHFRRFLERINKSPTPKNLQGTQKRLFWNSTSKFSFGEFLRTKNRFSFVFSIVSVDIQKTLCIKVTPLEIHHSVFLQDLSIKIQQKILNISPENIDPKQKKQRPSWRNFPLPETNKSHLRRWYPKRKLVFQPKIQEL